ncbi:helix-turn-helix domain-containing protein [Enterococcus casseliflavus]|uniref:helix-turn-helix domain-containing protein n=1 Tax=Enterococcus casseliflavus TaxID=37734 RepID=UPI00398FCFCA
MFNLFYDSVKKAAEAKGVSIRKTEIDLDFSNGSISKWNKSVPSVDKLLKVADYLEIPISDLLSKKQAV